MRRFRTRTLRKVNAEALMTATGQNIKRLLAFGGRGPKKLAQAAALRPADHPRPDLAHRKSKDHRRKRRIDSRFSTCWLGYGSAKTLSIEKCVGNPIGDPTESASYGSAACGLSSRC